MPKATLSLPKNYVNLIKSGKKSVIATLNNETFSQLQTKNSIKIIDTGDAENFVICAITQITKYPNFKEMLKAEGLQNTLPGISTVEQGVDVYQSFFGYPSGDDYRKQEHKIFGVLAMHVLVLVKNEK